MRSSTRLSDVITSASRRRTLALAVEHSALAFSAVFAALVLLLLLGTQILAWPWVLLLAGIGVALMLTKLRRARIDRYRVAQLVDRRLHLSDLLATAWYVHESPATPHSEIERSVLRRAEETIASLNPRQVFPFVWRRTWALAGSLAAIACVLFAVRYLFTSDLSLRRSMLPMPSLLRAASSERSSAPFARPDSGQSTGARALRPSQDLPRGEDRSASAASEKTGANGAASGSPKSPATAENRSGSQGNGTQNPAPDAMRAGLPHPEAANGAPPDKNSAESAKSGSPEDRPATASLTDRMKDAFSGLMQKMQDRSQTSTGNTSRKTSSSEGADARRQAGDSQQPGNAQQQGESSPQSQGENRQASAQSQAGAQASEKTPSTQTQSSGEAAARQGADPHSGVGRQDGEKAIKAAEQLRAMGKLDEIVGKRSAAVTGDMTVETHSSHQELQTRYSGRIGRHSESGGRIDRDEVPFALQKYVREYMEQVRKQAGAQTQ